MKLFQAANLGPCRLENRILRSATYEGMCDAAGYPTDNYHKLYQTLSRHAIGGIITGFTYISSEGRAMQPAQAGIECDAKISAFKIATGAVHANGSKIFMQIAHCGRQTTEAAVGGRIYGVSTKKSPYFNSRPKQLSVEAIELLLEKFAQAARRAQDAGFDGVQLHAAHGYLVHQFILPAVNTRKDVYGIDPVLKIGTTFLGRVVDAIRGSCGQDYPLLIKISSGDDYRHTFSIEQFINLIRFLDTKQVDGIEISYGTMDHALNIFRGLTLPESRILRYNPRYKSNSHLYHYIWKQYISPKLARKFKPFRPMYNLNYASLAKQYTRIPVISVGGFRTGNEMAQAIAEQQTDLVSLCRPFICEPDFVDRIANNPHYISRCKNCNQCAVMCDTPYPTKCYKRKERA